MYCCLVAQGINLAFDCEDMHSWPNHAHDQLTLPAVACYYTTPSRADYANNGDLTRYLIILPQEDMLPPVSKVGSSCNCQTAHRIFLPCIFQRFFLAVVRLTLQGHEGNEGGINFEGIGVDVTAVKGVYPGESNRSSRLTTEGIPETVARSIKTFVPRRCWCRVIKRRS